MREPIKNLLVSYVLSARFGRIGVCEKLLLEHIDIKSAYLHERYNHDRSAYVQHMPQFEGSFPHNSIYVDLEGGLFGFRPATYYYNYGLKKFFLSIRFLQSKHDPCIYIKRTPQRFILVSTTHELPHCFQRSQIHHQYCQLLTKCKSKRLGPPTKFLNWTIKHCHKSIIHMSQPDAIRCILQPTKMTQCNITPNPILNLKQINQKEDTTPLSPHKAH